MDQNGTEPVIQELGAKADASLVELAADELCSSLSVYSSQSDLA